MVCYESAASYTKLNTAPREPHWLGSIPGARPLTQALVPISLALMAGIAASLNNPGL